MAFYFNGKKYDTVEGFTDVLGRPHKDFIEEEESASPLLIRYIAVYKVKWIVPVHFLVFQTADNIWWSLLKCKSSITLKRSHFIDDVVYFDENNVQIKKENVVFETSDQSDKTIRDVIEMLKRDSKLFKGYDVLNNNCWIFAKFFFDKLAAVKTLDPLDTKTKARELLERGLAPFYSWATKTTWKGIFFCDYCLVAQGPEKSYSSVHGLSELIYESSVLECEVQSEVIEPRSWTLSGLLKPFYSWATKTKWKGYYFSALCKNENEASHFIHIAENCCHIENVEKAVKESYSNAFENDFNSEFDDVLIQWVAVYKTPLNNAVSNSKSVKKVRDTFGKQWTKVDYHAFIALKTSDDFYWSLEKQQDGIYINTKKELNDVINNFGTCPRAEPIECIKETRNTSCTLYRLINILQNEDNRYDAADDSCQHFSKRLYDKISARDCWDFIRPREYISLKITTLLTIVCGILTYRIYYL